MRAPSSKAPSKSKYYSDPSTARRTTDSSLLQNIGMYMNAGRVNPDSGLLQLLMGGSTTPVRKKYRRN